MARQDFYPPVDVIFCNRDNNQDDNNQDDTKQDDGTFQTKNDTKERKKSI